MSISGAERRRPDFFIVGHPRSGSGQLNAWLARHPDVYMAKKELHFFGSDLGYWQPPRSEENYLSFFANAGGARRVGEASTWYLFSERAAEEIRAFAGASAGILILLRNPVELLHSLHSHFVFRGDEDIEDFAEALAAEPDRDAGRRPEPPWHIPALGLRYSRIVRYAEQVRRFQERFDRVHVVFNHELRKDPRGTFVRVCEYLGLPTRIDGFERIFDTGDRERNSNRVPRSRALQHFLVHPRRQAVLEGVRPGPPGWRFTLRALRRLNIRYTDRPPLDPELRAALVRRFTPEVEALERLLGVDLPAWKRA